MWAKKGERGGRDQGGKIKERVVPWAEYIEQDDEMEKKDEGGESENDDKEKDYNGVVQEG